MGRGLLFQRQLPWSGRLSRQDPKTSPTNSVLAILSDSYPQLKGRLPTCYSPVRHFTGGPKPLFSCDLHVLGPPLTFALSQDQTLQFFTNLKSASLARSTYALLAKTHFLRDSVFRDRPTNYCHELSTVCDTLVSS